MTQTSPIGYEPLIQIRNNLPLETADLIDQGALAFLTDLHQHFEQRRQELLEERQNRQKAFDRGEVPGFLPETLHIRQGDWKIAGIPNEVQDRRVEITGPVDRKMIINGLNSGAKVFMADFEDSHAPNWQGTLAGHKNLLDAAQGDIEFINDAGKEYRLANDTATLMVRPRGWHLNEKHILIDGEQISASLFDFGLNLYLTHPVLEEKNQRHYYYLPKMEHHLEAKLWADVFSYAEERLNMRPGTIKATVLIETLPAVYQMHEILYQMRDHIIALNCGRWDYIFSFIKTFRNHPDKILPERGQVTMTVPFLRNYSRLLIQTCHQHGAMAMGGMAAQIPVRGDKETTEEALKKVEADKTREVTDGHDGTWVAHPGLIPTAMQVFDHHMHTPNQVSHLLDDEEIDTSLLNTPSQGSITHDGVRNNVEVGLDYLAAWLSGNGCVPLHHLMEDAATAEISRMQLWQWIKHQASLDDGTTITYEMVKEMLDEALSSQSEDLDEAGRKNLELAAQLIDDAISATEPPDFITLAAYEQLD